jgi:hypothetical protein
LIEISSIDGSGRVFHLLGQGKWNSLDENEFQFQVSTPSQDVEPKYPPILRGPDTCQIPVFGPLPVETRQVTILL